ncbi:MAG TPA: type II secretion system protein GspG [Pirellulales bacterium]|jgi:LPS sulfotransferase NodH|nr:type II secretion system protein GspG [Pirellulales bacterium]
MPEARLGTALQSLKPAQRPEKTTVADLVATRPAALQGSNRSYRKFVLLGHPRSGSSMIIDALDNHPQIVAFAELFHRKRIDFAFGSYENHSAKLMEFRNKWPLEFLEQYVFASYPDHVKAVGFKLFPEQVENHTFRCIWKWLQRNQEVQIIYLKRRNLLATYTSLKIAEQTTKFKIGSESERSQAVVHLKPRQCIAEWRSRQRYNKVIDKKIAGHETLDWFYEDVSQTPAEHLRQAQQFLGVDVCDLKINMIKQEVRPLSVAIENYTELQQHFLGTPWESFFEEPTPRSFFPGASQPGPVRAIPSADTRPNRKVSIRRKFREYSNLPAGMVAAFAASIIFFGLFFSRSLANANSPVDFTVATIDKTANRIELYALQNQKLPAKLCAIQDNRSAKEITDAWNQKLHYSVTGPDTFVITSYGSDGVPGGTGDGIDIVRTFKIEPGEICQLLGPIVRQ